MLLSSTNETPQELAAKKDRLAEQIVSLQTKSGALDRRDSEFATKRAFFKEQIDLVKQKLKKCELQPQTDANSAKVTAGLKHPPQTDASRQRGGRGRGRGKARGHGRGGSSGRGRGSSRGRGRGSSRGGGRAAGAKARNKKSRSTGKSSGKQRKDVRR